jgi:hypothetical protein
LHYDCHADMLSYQGWHLITGHKDLHNLVYPVSSLGAAKQLKHILPENRPYVLNLILKEMGLEEYGTNAVEGSLCKTSED